MPAGYNAAPLPNLTPQNVQPPRLVVASGDENQTAGDVSVTVTTADASEAAPTCVGVDGTEFSLGLSQAAVHVGISNGTNHILRFDRTVLDLRTPEGLPVNAEGESNAASVQEHARAYYASEREAADEWLRSEQQRIELHQWVSQAYVEDYARFTREFRACWSTTTSQSDRDRCQSTGGNNVTAPNAVASQRSTAAWQTAQQVHRERVQRINELEAECTADIGQAAARLVVGDPITPQQLPQLLVLPRQETRFILPLPMDASTRRIHVAFFDVPVEVDSAATPTRRDHFEWTLQLDGSAPVPGPESSRFGRDASISNVPNSASPGSDRQAGAARRPIATILGELPELLPASERRLRDDCEDADVRACYDLGMTRALVSGDLANGCDILAHACEEGVNAACNVAECRSR